MIKRLLNPTPIAQPKPIAALRIIVGLLMIYHGLEILNPEIMVGYQKWELFQSELAKTMVYVGKGSELVAGILLTLGLFTRIAALLLAGTMLYITFFVGHGHFWYEDQHPFMFVLVAGLLLFTGPGAWSVDQKIFGNNRT